MALFRWHVPRVWKRLARRSCRRRSATRSSAQHGDFVRVNDLLEAAEATAKRWFSTGFVGVADVSLGAKDDRIAMWNVGRARDAA